MSSSLRRFIGMVFLVTFVMVYCFVVMVFGDILVYGKHWVLQIAYFGFFGLIWVIPAGFIIKWMYKS
ncbi:DUF2842 domain-containing protein [Polycladidibacter stylochi]|uniref:DUF2842 domain-containing protein n=1 Tax=Polycladidibacter stylochi TaxID=1807766 RepID=UPI0008348282|nr:DUF2842 domain-containing protein [Pseudovibrio stylochi]